MGENDLDVRNETECNYLSYRQDCDGDYDTYCTYSESCPYRKIVKDCDGDCKFMHNVLAEPKGDKDG